MYSFAKLTLPTNNQVQLFREKRLLLHLHEQLVQQLDQNPNDWKLHFHSANLLAFSTDHYSYYNNRTIDINKSEEHYIVALKLLQSVHKKDQAEYTRKLQLSVPTRPKPTTTRKSFTSATDPKASVPVPNLALTQSTSVISANSVDDGSVCVLDQNDDEKQENNARIKSFTRKRHQKNASRKYTDEYIDNGLAVIVVLDDKNNIQSSTKCMNDNTLQAISKVYNKKKKKRPSIIEYLDIDDIDNPLSISLTADKLPPPIYTVPFNIIKGYTQIYYGYGIFLYENNRLEDAVHNLLECASWYRDSFVDPSQLSSLVLPPQFLFQDSIKKRHCINFILLTKNIDSVQKKLKQKLDKKYNQIDMNQFIKNYEIYKQQYELYDMDDNNNDVNQQYIDYKVYPQNIQYIFEEYIQLCEYYYKLGTLLIKFLKYAEAKKRFSFALKVFRKLKIRPNLYTIILNEIKRIQENHSALSERDRARNLAEQKRVSLSHSYSSSYSSVI